MTSLGIGKEQETPFEDELFLERLETLYDRSLAELRTFAERESRPFEEVRKCMAQRHCKYLFEAEPGSTSSKQEQKDNILRSTSHTLESLQKIAGLQAFFLVVNPFDPEDKGFLGGTLQGREFWRGHRGCGEAGAEAFKAQCLKASEERTRSSYVASTPVPAPNVQKTTVVPRQKGPASSLKRDVYASVRNAIRAASGVRNAEMKWSDHSRLQVYGIRLEGWPAGVPVTNPSTLTVAQNQQVLEALCTGNMYFTRTGEPQDSTNPAAPSDPGTFGRVELSDNSFDISWACEEIPDDTVESSSSFASASYSIPQQDLTLTSREATLPSPFIVSTHETQPTAVIDVEGIPRKRPRSET
ncbi:hypothetical protein SCP_1302180 [Sparassis crispa]|uniref:Uncharacterized protein n=1 Tax=Sparassis crispa TaxID=139825 RepID=A0A401H1Y2_9APHY|nr:hypothetical protein SCP_1302180 [Sparassis crispa]GBE88403.1 hypothetical protein SCP_1302180 [Sparassis crispa]